MTEKSLKYDVSTHFQFGKNWENYSKSITDELIDSSQQCLEQLVDKKDLEGKTFLDIGCGSGLHSLAALRMGASYVESVDFDPLSVKTTKSTLGKYWDSDNYKVYQGNILTDFNKAERKFDVVYSWGVLHHTGAMWEAIENASNLVGENGFLVIAIYNKTKFCEMWKKIKKKYTESGAVIRYLMLRVYTGLCFMRVLLKGKNPIKHLKEYKSLRGMSWWYDRIDWLGGFPYESASESEIFNFVEKLGFKKIKNQNTTPSFGLLSTGCGEYVFKKL